MSVETSVVIRILERQRPAELANWDNSGFQLGIRRCNKPCPDLGRNGSSGRRSQ